MRGPHRRRPPSPRRSRRELDLRRGVSWPRTRCSPPPAPAPTRSASPRSARRRSRPPLPCGGPRCAGGRRDRHRHRRLRDLAAARHARGRGADHGRHRGRAPAAGPGDLHRGRHPPTSASGRSPAPRSRCCPGSPTATTTWSSATATSASTPPTCDEALRLLRPGGIVAFDNALWHDRVADPRQSRRGDRRDPRAGPGRRSTTRVWCRCCSPSVTACWSPRRSGRRSRRPEPAASCSGPRGRREPGAALGDRHHGARLDQERRAADDLRAG